MSAVLSSVCFRFYSNYEALDWDIDLLKYKVAVAPYGGPVGELAVVLVVVVDLSMNGKG